MSRDRVHDAGDETLLPGLARMAARAAGCTVGIIVGKPGLAGLFGVQLAPPDLESLAEALQAAHSEIPDGRAVWIPDLWLHPGLSAHPLATRPPGLRSLASVGLPGIAGGLLVVGSPDPQVPLETVGLDLLQDVVGLAVAACHQAEQQAALADVTRRAVRADRMLRMVTEAVTCAEALTGLLGELCRHHGAPVGRIWKLSLEDGLMQEVSRFNEHHYYAQPPSMPVRSGNSMTAIAIASNEPQTVVYSQVTGQGQFALMAAAISSGLASQVSYPIWVQEERFGIALAFTTERDDLEAIVRDIASLANTIRPALFRKVSEERIRHMALHDDLTQLGNRAVFNECLDAAVAAAGRGEHGLALLYIDLDGFKRVNDTRGHEVGDKLLAAVAGRLRMGVREGDTVARLGGDEFAVVQPCNGQPYAAIQLGQRLVQMLGLPFDIDGQSSVIGASIGIALYPADGETPDELLRNADAALYDAKAAGRNTCRLFEPALVAIQEEKFLIEQDIKAAIEREAFTLAFQPICKTETLEVCGLEALLRWEHPTRGALSPDRFVPIAEASGLIVPLGRWALEAACREAATWPGEICLSVNLSPVQFRQKGLPEEIAGMLARTGLPPQRLNLEVTEGLLLDDSGLVLDTMEALRAHGVQITLDDFGTGYASLSYLRRFPFDRIKIDMSFIQGMAGDDGTLAIVEAVLSLSERLKLDVVAEGVETAEQLAMLRRLGCARVQGFFTGRPMTHDMARQLLAASTPKQAHG